MNGQWLVISPKNPPLIPEDYGSHGATATDCHQPPLMFLFRRHLPGTKSVMEGGISSRRRNVPRRQLKKNPALRNNDPEFQIAVI
jgi:hypothetical protein